MNNRAHLQFEERKYEDVQRDKSQKELDDAKAASDKNIAILKCQGEADQEYWNYVKLNGHEVPGKPGTYTAPVRVWDSARQQKKDVYGECIATIQ